MEGMSVRRARLADRRAHLRLLDGFRAGLPGPERRAFAETMPRLWRWKYSSPWRRGVPPTVVLARRRTRLLGGFSYIPVRMRIAGRERVAHWIVDLIISSRGRGAGVGARLIDWARARLGQTLAIGTTAGGREAFLKRRFGERLDLEYWQRSLDGSGSLDAGRLRAVAVDRFSPEVDRFCRRASAGYAACVVRDSRYLNWRYGDAPFPKGTYLRYLLRDEAGLRGVLVLRTGKVSRGRGAIKELFVHRGDLTAFKAGLAHASSLLRKAGARSVQILIDERCPGWAAALRGAGFLPLFRSTEMLFRGVGASLKGPIHVSLGDSDLDLIWG